MDLSSAPLAKLLRRFVDDDVRSEGLHLLAIVLGSVFIAFAQFLGWAALSEVILSNPLGPTAIAFFLTQSSLMIAFMYVAVLGFSTELRVSVSDKGITVIQPEHSVTYSWDMIVDVETIDSDVYQKHYRRYKATSLVGRILSTSTILVTTTQGPLIIGLPDDELPQFADALHKVRASQLVSPDLMSVSV